MQRTTIQVPMSKDLRKKAELVSADMGFSSLQETIRVLLTKLARHELTIRVEEHVEEITNLTPEAEARYKKAIEEIKDGRNITNTKNTKELLQLLRT